MCESGHLESESGSESGHLESESRRIRIHLYFLESESSQLGFESNCSKVILSVGGRDNHVFTPSGANWAHLTKIEL